MKAKETHRRRAFADIATIRRELQQIEAVLQKGEDHNGHELYFQVLRLREQLRLMCEADNDE